MSDGCGVKLTRQMATRFPGVLLRLPTQLVEGYASLGLLGLGTHERFSLKSACDFFVRRLDVYWTMTKHSGRTVGGDSVPIALGTPC